MLLLLLVPLCLSGKIVGQSSNWIGSRNGKGPLFLATSGTYLESSVVNQLLVMEKLLLVPLCLSGKVVSQSGNGRGSRNGKRPLFLATSGTYLESSVVNQLLVMEKLLLVPLCLSRKIVGQSSDGTGSGDRQGPLLSKTKGNVVQ